MSPRGISTAEAGAYLGAPASTLVYWRAQRTGPRWYKLGKRVMYDRADLDAFIEQQKLVARAS